MKLKLTLIMSGILAVSGCGGEDSKTLPSTTLPNNSVEVADDPAATITDSAAYNDYGVHDPSVLKVPGADGEPDEYFVFGSHLGAAVTTDLMNWTDASNIDPVTGDINTSTLFDTYEDVAAEGIAWTDGFIGSWAADVIQSQADGRYYFYYNHCAFDNPNTPERDEVCWHRSYLGVAVADTAEGPYENVGLIMRSGHTDEELAGDYPVYDTDGNRITSYNPAVHPNAIDPAAFYDKEGNLWMVYGSYSGGIYILAMDETTMLAEPNQGFGKHLVGGDFNAIEGSYVMYSPESDYYYLFWSNGGFNAADGYNIRVARSRTPDGPYLDAAGNDMVNARVANNMGVKLMGGFNFVAAFGDTEAEWGYRSPGHNSALYDAELGKHLLFTHTRFPADQVPFEQYHAVRVHEMWINEDDWLVASPQRYAPTSGDNVVDFRDLAGDYRIVMHGIDTNTEVNESYYVTLTEQGRNITGQLSGFYRLYDEENRIHVIVDGQEFRGVMQWQWNKVSERFDPAISAMNSAGEMLWAVKMEDKTSSEIVSDIADVMPIPDTLNVTSLTLPIVATNGTVIEWETSNRNYVRLPREVEDDAEEITTTVVRPAYGSGDQTVTLTANVWRDGEEIGSHGFDVVVPARVENNRTAHFAFEDNLSESLGNLADGAAIGDRPYNDGAVAYAAGVNGQAVSLDGANGVRFPNDLITNYEYTVSYWMNPTVIANFTPSFFGAVDEFPVDDIFFADRWVNFLPANWDGQAHFWSHNFIPDVVDNWYDGFTGTTLTPGEWVHVAFSVNNGAVNVYLDGVQVAVAGGLPDYYSRRNNDAVFTFGVNYWDLPFNGLVDDVKIYDAALSAAEVQVLDVDGDVATVAEKLEIAYNQLDLGNISEVISDMNLVNYGAFASAVSWTSSDESVVDTLGYVTRPGSDQVDAVVTLVATISLGGESVTKEFTATVLADVPPTPIARYSFEEDLVDSVGNFADGVPVAPGLVETDASMVYADGVVGSAISFAGGASAGAKLADNLITGYNYAFAMWLNPNSLNQFTTTFFGYDTDSSWISVVPFGPGSGNTMLWSGSINWFDGDSGSQIPTGEWTHFAASVEQGELKIWLNGTLVNELSGFPDVFSPADPSQFSIGTNLFDWDLSYDGLMDELVIYDQPITQVEVDGLYAEPTAAE